jgi:hypothetical protein
MKEINLSDHYNNIKMVIKIKVKLTHFIHIVRLGIVI